MPENAPNNTVPLLLEAIKENQEEITQIPTIDTQTKGETMKTDSRTMPLIDNMMTEVGNSTKGIGGIEMIVSCQNNRCHDRIVETHRLMIQEVFVQM